MCRHQLSSFKEVCVFTHSERESIQLKIQVLKSLLHQLLEVNLITLNPVLQALAAHFQQLRGFGHVAAAGPKDFADSAYDRSGRPPLLERVFSASKRCPGAVSRLPPEDAGPLA